MNRYSVYCKEKSFVLAVAPSFIEGLQAFNDLSVILIDADEVIKGAEYEQIRSFILKAKQSFELSECKASGQLQLTDEEYERLIAKIGELQRQRENKETEHKNLSDELASNQRMLQSYRQSLENARSHLASTQKTLNEIRARMEHDEAVRNAGIGLMFIPIVGPIIGECPNLIFSSSLTSTLYLNNATGAKNQAESEVQCWVGRVESTSRDLSNCETKVKEKMTEISNVKMNLEEIEKVKQELSRQRSSVAAIQEKLRAAVRVLGKLTGTASVAEAQTRKFVFLEPIMVILQEIHDIVAGISEKVQYLLCHETGVKNTIDCFEQNSKKLKALCDKNC
uniref:Uncharacterized protein n=1 Tax=Scleropages formosus TaxID=113540 RepID=A0A8C9TKU3_SCLFO